MGKLLIISLGVFMKKKVLVVLIIVAIVISIIIYKYKDISIYYKIKQIESDTVNYLNGKFNSRTYKYTIEDYDRYLLPISSLNHHDINELIDSYIEMFEESTKMYIAQKNGEEYSVKVKKRQLPKGIETGKGIVMDNDVSYLALSLELTDTDVENYNNGRFRDLLIEKLKECLEYEEENGKIKWVINSTEDKTIELPYNCYIKYQAYKREKNDEFKKALSASIIQSDRFVLSNNINSKAIEVKYETNDGNIKIKAIDLIHFYNNNVEYYDMDIRSILYNKGESIAHITLKSHTGDRLEAEYSAEAQRLHDEDEAKYSSEDY